MSSITILKKPSCVQCNASVRYMDKVGVDYDSRDMSQDLDAHTLAKDLGYMQAPVTIVQDTEGNLVDHWSGFNSEKIDQYA